jgi:hypothetical protein
MSLWYRVFGTTDAPPDPDALLRTLRETAPDVSLQFELGERGWLRAAVRLPRADAPLYLDRFWRDEEGIRAELQAWAAWLETCDDNPHSGPLMQHMTSTQQVFTLRRPADAAALDAVCTAVCRFLAQATTGVYQVDGQGFFDADGNLLIPSED